MAHNDGDRTTDSFDWHVLFPKDAPILEGRSGQPGDDVTIDGVVYTHRWLRHPFPLRKGDPFHIMSIRAKVPILWYIRSDDGTFPGLNKDGTVRYGRIELPG